MFKLVLEKAEEPEIKLPTSAGSWKKQESSRKTSISALLTMPKPLTVYITITQSQSRLQGEISNLRYADDTTLMPESEELKSLLMNMKEESEEVGLKLNIWKTKIMASGPITSWQIDGETVGTEADFILGGSKIRW